MMAQGFESHYPMEKLSVRGYAEVLRSYREIMAIRRRLAKALLARAARTCSSAWTRSDFNLGLERRLKDAGIPAIHYVSPSVWAWRGWRVRTHRALGEPHPGDVPVRGSRSTRRPACR